MVASLIEKRAVCAHSTLHMRSNPQLNLAHIGIGIGIGMIVCVFLLSVCSTKRQKKIAMAKKIISD